MNATLRRLIALALLAVSTAASAGDTSLWPEHEARLRDATKRVDAINANPEIPKSDADAKAVVEELLAEPHRRLDATALTGEWKVRSLQGGSYGIYTYPWFKARVTNRDGRLFFEKTSGSQRRSGWLVPPASGSDDWTFVGGATVNEDPQVGYSLSDGADAPRESDSVGAAWGIAEDRVLMLLDVGENGYEIYQLKR
jgi:hypothetical protein